MAYRRPDVYIEEILTPEIAPNGISTSIAAFLGFADRGPANTPIFIDSFASFKRTFGDAVEGESLFYSVLSFFENGGAACYIIRLIDVSACEGDGNNPATVLPANHSFTNAANNNPEFLKFEGGYRGLPSFGSWAKGLKVKLSLNTSFSGGALAADAQATDFSLQVNTTSGLAVGDLIKVEGEIGGNANQTAYFKITGIRSDSSTGQVKKFVDISATPSAVITAAATVTLLAYDVEVSYDKEVFETFDRLSMNPDNDRYFETVINDEQVGSTFVRVSDLITGTLLSSDRELNSVSNGVGELLDTATAGQDEKANFGISESLL